MSAYPYYNMRGEPIGRMEAMLLFEDHQARIVGRDERDGVLVSTVLLVLDHGHGLSERPVIFETMVFEPDCESEVCDRYSTLEEAQAGHRWWCVVAFSNLALDESQDTRGGQA